MVYVMGYIVFHSFDFHAQAQRPLFTLYAYIHKHTAYYADTNCLLVNIRD